MGVAADRGQAPRGRRPGASGRSEQSLEALRSAVLEGRRLGGGEMSNGGPVSDQFPISAVVGQDEAGGGAPRRRATRGSAACGSRERRGARRRPGRGLFGAAARRRAFVEIPAGAPRGPLVGTLDITADSPEGRSASTRVFSWTPTEGCSTWTRSNLLPRSSGRRAARRGGERSQPCGAGGPLPRPPEPIPAHRVDEPGGGRSAASAPRPLRSRGRHQGIPGSGVAGGAVRRRLEFDADPRSVEATFEPRDAELAARLGRSRPRRSPICGRCCRSDLRRDGRGKDCAWT